MTLYVVKAVGASVSICGSLEARARVRHWKSVGGIRTARHHPIVRAGGEVCERPRD